MQWSVETARQFAAEGRLEEWIHSYLSTGRWINMGLSDGLKKAPRWWLGPLLVPIEKMIRTCGPEADMPYKVTIEHWNNKTQEMAIKFDNPLALPPVIIQSVKADFYLRDGNHRLEAARKKGWQSLWALIWFDSEDDWKNHQFQDIKS